MARPATPELTPESVAKWLREKGFEESVEIAEIEKIDTVRDSAYVAVVSKLSESLDVNLRHETADSLVDVLFAVSETLKEMIEGSEGSFGKVTHSLKFGTPNGELFVKLTEKPVEDSPKQK